MVSLVEPVQVERRSVAQLQPTIGVQRHERLVQVAGQFRQHLGGRTIWNVSSTATGGGVAEMLHVLLGYAEDLAIPVQWRVITGDAEFFVITKRIHNQIHGETAGGPLTGADADHYARMLAANAAELLDEVRPGDLVLLHDPQTAGLTRALVEGGSPGGVALPHRRGLAERRDAGGLGVPAAAAGGGARVRVHPA